tara:strand:+ start:699 stop:1091 length:393 start_codon:yes stop_codon:yes gene_type:complete
MKKSELKKILKPLIKECIKEVLFEEGVLSNVVSEVVHGMAQSQPLVEQRARTRRPASEVQEKREQISQTKKKLLDTIGRESYGGVDLFEGTKPMPTKSKDGSPMAGIAPDDPGVDITQIPGMQHWGQMVK